ncbi:MAG TPA: nucleotide sugar dehydrogenase [Pseudonocardiaceae bacterium]
MTATMVTSGPVPEPTYSTHCRVGVVGLGYAGLPQAIAFAAAGHPVVGVDIDLTVTGLLRSGRSPVDTVRHDEVIRSSSMLTVSDDATALASCSAVLVCVPTPLDSHGRPDLTALRAATRMVTGQLTAGHLVVIESTVYPGVTDGVVKPILESSGLLAGVHFNLAFAPERVDPGNLVFDPTNTPKVIGGLTSVCAYRTKDLYQDVVSAVHVTKGIREAEAAKILENTYRQVNLALVHEFAAYCDAQGIDVAATIDAAATKPFGFQPFYPGVGVGGHCIPVDPMYLASSGRELGTPMHLVELAQQVNDRRPAQIAEHCMKLLASSGVPPAGARVLVLGLTYKPNVADLRNTPAVPLIRLLVAAGIEVMVHDPLVPGISVDDVRHDCVADVTAAVREADLVLLAQRHRHYQRSLLQQAGLLYVADSRAPDRAETSLAVVVDESSGERRTGRCERETRNVKYRSASAAGKVEGT